MGFINTFFKREIKNRFLLSFVVCWCAASCAFPVIDAERQDCVYELGIEQPEMGSAVQVTISVTQMPKNSTHTLTYQIDGDRSIHMTTTGGRDVENTTSLELDMTGTCSYRISDLPSGKHKLLARFTCSNGFVYETEQEFVVNNGFWLKITPSSAEVGYEEEVTLTLNASAPYRLSYAGDRDIFIVSSKSDRSLTLRNNNTRYHSETVKVTATLTENESVSATATVVFSPREETISIRNTSSSKGRAQYTVSGGNEGWRVTSVPPSVAYSVSGSIITLTTTSPTVATGEMVLTTLGQNRDFSFPIVVPGLKGNLQQLSLSPKSQSVERNEPFSVKAVGRFEDGTTEDISDACQWSATDGVTSQGGGRFIATADGNGIVTAKLEYGGRTFTDNADIKVASISRLEIVNLKASYRLGDQFTLSGNDYWSDGRITHQGVFSCEGVVRFDSISGKFECLRVGKFKVTYSVGKQSTTIESQVIDTPVSLSISPSSSDNWSILMGSEHQFRAYAIMSSGEKAEVTSECSWSGIGISSLGGGRFAASYSGSNIRVIAEYAIEGISVRAESVGTVKNPDEIYGMEVSPESKTIHIGEEVTVTAYALDRGGKRLREIEPLLSLSTSSPSGVVAIVGQKITAVGLGTVKIDALFRAKDNTTYRKTITITVIR